MTDVLSVIGLAVWLGILTSISPCPLATNVAAISFLSSRLQRPGRILAAGLLYTLGRMAAYAALAVLAVAGILSIPGAAGFLQMHMNRLLGPVLILVGMVLLELISFRTPSLLDGQKLQGRVEKAGLLGAAALGFLFALSFCPVSAGLFFGRLVPLALEHGSALVPAAAYGVGTAAPVVVFAVLFALGARAVGAWFNRLSRFDRWARGATGVVFIAAGVYYCLRYIFRIFG